MAMAYPEEKRRKILSAIARLGVLNIAIEGLPVTRTSPGEETRRTMIAERDRLEREIWARIVPDATRWEDLR